MWEFEHVTGHADDVKEYKELTACRIEQLNVLADTMTKETLDTLAKNCYFNVCSARAGRCRAFYKSR